LLLAICEDPTVLLRASRCEFYGCACICNHSYKLQATSRCFGFI